MQRIKKYKVVRVDWLDAHGGVRGGWRDVSTVAKRKPAVSVSFGVLLRQDNEYVVICPHFAGDDNGIDMEKDVSADGEMAIPMKWVKKITKLGLL